MNILKLKITTSVMLVCPLIGSFASAQTLREAVLIALSQYPSIQAAQSKIEAADSDIIRAQGAHWPQVAWTGTYNAYNTGSVPNNWIQSPTVSMNVWSGWRIQSDVERSRSLADASRQQQRITRDDVALLSTEGYLNWAHQLQMVRLARENVNAHQKLANDINTIVQVDGGRRIDLNQAQVRLENAKLTLEQRQAELVAAEQRLNRMLLGQMPRTPSGTEYVLELNPESLQQALGYINETHPVIAQLRAQTMAAEANVRSARAQYSPTVNVTYGKQTYQGTAQGDYLAQLIVSVPLFDGGTAYGATGAAQGNLRAIEASLKESDLILRERVTSLWADWISAENRRDLGVTQVKTSQALVDGYKSQFLVGRRSLLDLLNVQSDLYNYQSNAENAAYEFQIGRARILASVGKLALSFSGSPGSPAITSPGTPSPSSPGSSTPGPAAAKARDGKNSATTRKDTGNEWYSATVGVLPASLIQLTQTETPKP